jgi:hypothetical protein
MAALVLLVRALVRILALAARILLLLTRFLTAALLLAGLPAWVLVLLTRVLILVGHWDPPLQRTFNNGLEPPLVAREPAFRWAHYMAAVCRRRGGRNLSAETTLYKPFQLGAALLPHPVPTVRKWDKAR